ncbi:TMEM175 family protein [Spirosoma flavus]
MSFLILSIYWTGHQYRFYFIKLITRKHLWINGIFIALGHLIYIQE